MKGLVVNQDQSVSLKTGLELPRAQEGEVMVRVHSASVNPFDRESAEGRFDPYFKEYGVDKQVQTGLEFSGTVQKDGKRFKQGDAVFGYVHMITGWKTHAEYIAINEDYLALKPENSSFVEAAAIPLGALTTLVAIQEVGQLKSGMKLLINGAAGGLGVHGIQVGKILGAEVTAVATTERFEYLQSLGADHLIDYSQQKVTDISECFDVILDLTNSLNLNEVKPLLTENGKFIPAEPNDENGGNLESKNVGYLMVTNGDFHQLTQIAQWMSEGKLKAIVDSEYNFTKHQQAFDRVQTKGRKGRVVMSW